MAFSFQVKRLLRADVSAVDVKFDILNDELDKQKEDEQEDYKDANDTIDAGDRTIASTLPVTFDENSNMSSALDNYSDNDGGLADEILPDISSSDDDNDSICVKNEEQKPGDGGGMFQTKTSLEDEFTKRLLIIKDKKLEQELRIHNASNPFLKQRFQKVLDELQKEEEEITKKRNAASSSTSSLTGPGAVGGESAGGEVDVTAKTEEV